MRWIKSIRRVRTAERSSAELTYTLVSFFWRLLTCRPYGFYRVDSNVSTNWQGGTSSVGVARFICRENVRIEHLFHLEIYLDRKTALHTLSDGPCLQVTCYGQSLNALQQRNLLKSPKNHNFAIANVLFCWAGLASPMHAAADADDCKAKAYQTESSTKKWQKLFCESAVTKPAIMGFHVGDARVKKMKPASKKCDHSGPIIWPSPLGVMLTFLRFKNSDAAQPRVTNVKTPIRGRRPAEIAFF